MSDISTTDLTPAERADDIPRALRAVKAAVRDALRGHKLAGNRVAVWRDARVVWFQPEDIPVEPELPGGV